MKRTFHVVAIPIRIVYNNFGDHDPNGRMFVLKENERRVRDEVARHPFSTVELVQPLTLRANVGDVVEILFENQLDHAASMHFQEAQYDVLAADGAHVGFNSDTTAAPGEQILYRLNIVKQGTHYFSDLGNPLSSEAGSNVHGLFGGLIAERRFSTWTDPVTGGPLHSGVYADIHHPMLPSFREYTWYFNDEPEQLDLTGNRPLDTMTLQEAESVHAVNYRSEPLRTALEPSATDRRRRRLPGLRRRGSPPRLLGVRRSAHPDSARVPGRSGQDPPDPRRRQGDARLPLPRPPVAAGCGRCRLGDHRRPGDLPAEPLHRRTALRPWLAARRDRRCDHPLSSLPAL
jgi:hypothetical protein